MKSVFYDFAEKSFLWNQDLLIKGQRCDKCFLTKQFCICDAIKDIFKTSSGKILSTVAVLMHYKEWGRGSNTGKLISIGDSKHPIFLFGNRSDEDKLIELLRSKPSLVLYPTKDSRPIHEYRHLFDENKGDVVLCAIDSTWSQSSAMEKIIPDDIPRVHVDMHVSGPSLFLNRRQSANKSKVSTIEAIAFALSSLGESPQACETLLTALQHSVDAVLRQGGKATAYGSDIQPIVDENDEGLPISTGSVKRPTKCYRCNATARETSFRNFGLRWISLEDVERIQSGELNILFEGRQKFSSSDNSKKDHSDTLYRVWKCKNCDDCLIFEEHEDSSDNSSNETLNNIDTSLEKLDLDDNDNNNN